MRRSVTVLALATAVAAVASAYGSTPRAKVLLRSTSLGRVLVAANGHTLYLFEADKAGKSTCYGQCAAFWPPLLTSTPPLAGAGVKAALLGTTKRKDGKLQVTYARHPLYFFVQDKKAGQLTGEGLKHFGGSWYVVSTAGAKVQPSQGDTSGTTTTAPSSPGYGTTTGDGTTTGGGYGRYGP
jgi:predicted lipoprotein with Yx(FWY)xxD motif